MKISFQILSVLSSVSSLIPKLLSETKPKNGIKIQANSVLSALKSKVVGAIPRVFLMAPTTLLFTPNGLTGVRFLLRDCRVIFSVNIFSLSILRPSLGWITPRSMLKLSKRISACLTNRGIYRNHGFSRGASFIPTDIEPNKVKAKID